MNIKKAIPILIVVFLLIIPWLVGPIVNNQTARGIVRGIVAIPTPKNTDIVETVYKAGDLTEAGEGVEFFGAALLKTKLTLPELTKHYNRYSSDSIKYYVVEQPESKVDVIEKDPPRFLSMLNTGTHDYYMVYAWGSSDQLISWFDIRKF